MMSMSFWVMHREVHSFWFISYWSYVFATLFCYTQQLYVEPEKIGIIVVLNVDEKSTGADLVMVWNFVVIFINFNLDRRITLYLLIYIYRDAFRQL